MLDPNAIKCGREPALERRFSLHSAPPVKARWFTKSSWPSFPSFSRLAFLCPSCPPEVRTFSWNKIFFFAEHLGYIGQPARCCSFCSRALRCGGRSADVSRESRNVQFFFFFKFRLCFKTELEERRERLPKQTANNTHATVVL